MMEWTGNKNSRPMATNTLINKALLMNYLKKLIIVMDV